MARVQDNYGECPQAEKAAARFAGMEGGGICCGDCDCRFFLVSEQLRGEEGDDGDAGVAAEQTCRRVGIGERLGALFGEEGL